MATKKAAVIETNKSIREMIITEMASNGVQVNVRETRADRISFGLPALDLVTGGGVPVGMLSMLWGQEGSGKTTSAMYLAREHINMWKARDERRIVVWIDGERTFDESYAESLGLDLDWIVPHRPAKGETAETTLELIAKIAEKPNLRVGKIGLIVVDSMNAFSTARMQEAGMKDKNMGNSAKMWTTFCKRFPAPIDEGHIALVMIAQMRINIGQMFGNPETLEGGMMLRHMTRLRLKFNIAADVAAGGKKKKAGEKAEEKADEPEAIEGVKPGTIVATTLRPTVVKSSVYGAVHKGAVEMELRRHPSTYIDPLPQLVWVGQQLAVFTNSKGEPAGGSGYWCFQGQNIAVGAKNVTKALKEDRELLGAVATEVRQAIQNKVKGGEALPVSTAEGSEAEDDFLADLDEGATGDE